MRMSSKTKLGQNFLRDQDAARRIVAACDHWRGLSYRDAVAVFGSMVSSEAQESGRGSLDRAARALAAAEGVALTMRRAS
jgi:hypothetical protein